MPNDSPEQELARRVEALADEWDEAPEFHQSDYEAGMRNCSREIRALLAELGFYRALAVTAQGTKPRKP
jgi:hypothetical protein